MTNNLWSTNTPERFWRLLIDLPTEQWQIAIDQALPCLELDHPDAGIVNVLEVVLGEGQFGPDHWQLSSLKKMYYTLKPFLPRPLTRWMRRFYGTPKHKLSWPIEDRYVHFLFEAIKQLFLLTGKTSFPFINIWPDGNQFAFVITHDVETSRGQANLCKVADLEEGLGFRSSFNIIPERYKIDKPLLVELKNRGFEIGVHGLKHDGKLYSSKAIFDERAKRINQYLKDYDSVGFRSPLTHRQPDWMQALEVEYDLSFFDTDPYEPIPGGTMSIWPFELGRFMELPYTMVQDYTLINVLGEKTPETWLQKVGFIKKYHGMALINVHPDYLNEPLNWDLYAKFLKEMKTRSKYWHALPHEISSWWRARMYTTSVSALQGASQGDIHFEGGKIILV